MQQTRFMVLTGHLNDYPLPDLVGILRHQRKTGRLLIEYPIGPSSFFFKDGELVDVQLGELSGIQAVCIAISQPNASFNFNPLVLPSAQSIDNSLQRVVTQLLDCWDDETPATKVKGVGEGRAANAFLPSASNEFIDAERLLPDRDNILSLPPSPAVEAAATTHARPALKRRRQALFAGAALVLLLSVPAVIALTTNSFGRREARSSSNSPPVEVKENSTNAAPNFSVSSQNETPSDATSNATATTSPNNTTRGERRAPYEQFRTETGALKRNETTAPLAAAPSPSPSASTESDAAAAARKPNAVAPSAASTTSSATSANATSGEQTPTVVLQVENGRVTGANIANRRPGMEAFEASALRIARQRRFPANTTGTVTMHIKVTQQK